MSIQPIKDINSTENTYVVQCKKATINYTDSSTSLFKLPVGARLIKVYVDATTSWNGTTPRYSLGYAGSTTAIVNATAMPSSTVRANDISFASGSAVVTTAEQLVGTFTGGGSNTTGQGVLTVLYIV